MSSKRIAVVGSVIHPLAPGSMALWIDFADAATITTGTGGISQADDKSGNGYHLTQATSGNRPNYSGSLNGRNIATFGGGPDYLIRSSSMTIGKNVSGLTGYLVWKHNSAPTSARENLVVLQGGGGVTRLAMYGGLTSNKLSSQGRRLDGDSTVTVTGAANLGTGWHIATVVQDYAAGTITQYLDGVSDGSGSLASTGSSSNTDSPSITVSSGNASFDLVGGVAELLLYNAAHNAATMAQLWGYLRNKWAL